MIFVTLTQALMWLFYWWIKTFHCQTVQCVLQCVLLFLGGIIYWNVAYETATISPYFFSLVILKVREMITRMRLNVPVVGLSSVTGYIKLQSILTVSTGEMPYSQKNWHVCTSQTLSNWKKKVYTYIVYGKAVEHLLMVQWMVLSLKMDQLNSFMCQPVVHNWCNCNKGCGIRYPVCEMVHIKDPLVLIGGSEFPF